MTTDLDPALVEHMRMAVLRALDQDVARLYGRLADLAERLQREVDVGRGLGRIDPVTRTWLDDEMADVGDLITATRRREQLG